MAALAPNHLDRLDISHVMSLPHMSNLVVAIGEKARVPDLIVADSGRQRREQGARSPGEDVVSVEVRTRGGGGRRRGSIKEIGSGLPPAPLGHAGSQILAR
ncbi:Os02g0285050 [Oryza sativa Japonica Group]|uniref:Os02g0285050 protein n=1 Tax=Oryza sativa subsp. japonica TaxID=39947 RepID=A0A0P0VHN5_ORYSJ|nr:Os02g0285050 [Oryza sativa Japonica Group]